MARACICWEACAQEQSFSKPRRRRAPRAFNGKTVAEPALTTSAGKRSKAIDVTPESQSGTIIESSVHSTPAKAAPKGKQPDAIELLWNLRQSTWEPMQYPMPFKA